jgi:hypothetical protein
MIKRDFLKELKDKIKAIDERTKQKTVIKMQPKKYNVHKRSLPIGIDQIVVYSVTKDEANWWTEKLLKTRCYQQEPEESKTIIYYDIIPIDATPRERSIFNNPNEVMLA